MHMRIGLTFQLLVTNGHENYIDNNGRVQLSENIMLSIGVDHCATALGNQFCVKGRKVYSNRGITVIEAVK